GAVAPVPAATPVPATTTHDDDGAAPVPATTTHDDDGAAAVPAAVVAALPAAAAATHDADDAIATLPATATTTTTTRPRRRPHPALQLRGPHRAQGVELVAAAHPHHAHLCRVCVRADRGRAVAERVPPAEHVGGVGRGGPRGALRVCHGATHRRARGHA